MLGVSDTFASPPGYALLLGARIIRESPSGTLKLRLINNRKDTLFFSPVLGDAFNSLLMHYVRVGDRLECRFRINGLPEQPMSISLPPGDLFVLSFGNLGDLEATRGGSKHMAIDNLLLADDTEDGARFSTAASDFTVVPDGNRFTFRTDPAPQDSLAHLEVAETPACRPLLFSRQLALASPYTLDFPLRPGDYFVRMAVIRKNGSLSDYGPVKKVTITAAEEFQKKFGVLGADILEESADKSVSVLAPGQWYVLRLKLTVMQGCFAVFYLHHTDCVLGGPHNKGGYFDRRENYVFNFSFGEQKWFYASREGPKGRSIRVDGQRYLYIDDSDKLFQPDMQTNTVKIRFQLLPEALLGDWVLSGYMERDTPAERSYLFHAPYRVISEREQALKRAADRRERITTVAVFIFSVALLAAGALLTRRLMQKRKREREVSLLSILKSQGIYIKDANHRHRHIIQRAQTFILENLGKDISLSDIAAHVNMSGTWVGIIFKEATGYTVVQFINKVKIEKARELLLQGNLNSTDVAMSVGYGSLKHFRRVFKEQIGKNPSDFRKNA